MVIFASVQNNRCTELFFTKVYRIEVLQRMKSAQIYI
jgi:hypothetical protein